MLRQLPRNEYTVGWVCALPVEFAAAQEMLDEEHANLQHEPSNNDENMYAPWTLRTRYCELTQASAYSRLYDVQ